MMQIFPHILSNSIDHGIEDSEERLSLGKPEAGSILVEAGIESTNLILKIRDDGKGIHPQNILAQAKTKGLIEEENSLDPKQSANLVFMNGFSSSGAVSAFSGRGVGMSAVKEFIEGAGGFCHIVLSERVSSQGYQPFHIHIEIPQRLYWLHPEEGKVTSLRQCKSQLS